MALNQSMMDDLVVIPTITLNPKKAKKKLKKAARMSDDLEVTQLPVYQETTEKMSPVEFSQSPAKAQCLTAARSSPKSKSQVRSAPAPKPVAEPIFNKPAAFNKVVATPAPKPQTCAAQALATSNICKRSWYDITEEDEDDFIGLSFAQCSAAQMIA
eukprot:gnl/MRDRNA2_/MRDRNA2_90870_c0_seq1.p1 gnl/MRDRNA2_/MRDRNA2_90870_c0~~gnl/MRDRNA2_/MRDRNA2_90870_c0_seq1.p1  ORF type:complete len:157 (+),score=47.98 gnl/MRDRNA2_/MRDRNA2_90870_c0_seq1:120-590(+)